MPFISEPLDDVHEAQPAEEGEYDLRIVKAEERTSKSGNEMVSLMIVFDDPNVEAPPFNHFLMAWDSDTPEDQIRMRKIEIKRFCAAFNAEEDFEAEDLQGLVGTGIFVSQETGDDGIVRNRMRLPRLKE